MTEVSVKEMKEVKEEREGQSVVQKNTTEMKTQEGVTKDKLSMIFKRKPLRIILLLLQDKIWYISLLARESKQSYVHAAKIIESLENAGLVSAEYSGKRKVVKLTEKGEKLARMFDELMKIFS